MPGDVLTHIDDQRLQTRGQTLSLIAATAPGERVSIRYVRADGSPAEAEAVLAERDPYAGS
jgi:PDZ domain-containing secreted protein